MKRFEDATPEMEEADRSYRAAGQSTGFGALKSSDFMLPNLSVEETTGLYDRRMAAKRSAGRQIYDSIRLSSREGKCPLCGHREVMTLDHYLPKSQYPALTVNPINLIPACTDCNKLKSSLVEPTLHPYYDNIENEPWLQAEVLPRTPAVTLFFVECPQDWPKSLVDRVSTHFKVFGLDRLYASQAARIISGQHQLFVKLFNKGGERLVRIWLEDQARTWKAHEINCWESALYAALTASDWFCNGGFSL